MLEIGKTFECSGLFFKHTISPNPPCDANDFHTHNLLELIYIVGGNASHVIEGRRYKLEKGDLILIQPFKYHFLQIDGPEDYERYNFLVDASLHGIESASLISDSVEIVNLSSNAMAKDIFTKLDVYLANTTPEMFAKIFKLLLGELFYSIHLFSKPEANVGDVISPVLSQALQYINGHIFTVTGIGEVAQALFVSESYLFRLFRTSLHQTPSKYIQSKRLLAAQRRICLGEKPTAVYEECGFRDYTVFYRSYRGYFGYPPSKERQNMLLSPTSTGSDPILPEA